jgi:multiple sugar transport system substrate-binding protein
MKPFQLQRRLLLAAICLGSVAGFTPSTLAQDQTEVVYASNLDPANTKDPRAAAQTKIIAAFEAANPGIKVKVLVDPTQATYLRALKSKSASPDVIKVIGYGLPEYAATGSLQPLDDLIKKDSVDQSDWLLPLEKTQLNGHFFGLPLDYRIPLFLYRKSALSAAGIQPPKTWDEVCELSKKLTSQGKIGYALGVGASGGLGGAQAFGETLFSSMSTEGSGVYFNEAGDKFMVSEASFVRAAQTIKDMFTKCKVPVAALQFGYNEIHDGLRAGTIDSATFGLYRFAAIANGGAGDDLAWAPPPAYEPNGKKAVYGYDVSLNANSTHKEAAWKLLKFFGSLEAQNIALEGGEVVARKSAYKAGGYLDTPAGKRQSEWAKLVSDRGVLPSYPLSLTAFNQALGEALQRMVLKNTSPKDAYTEVKTRYEKAMAKPD